MCGERDPFVLLNTLWKARLPLLLGGVRMGFLPGHQVALQVKRYLFTFFEGAVYSAILGPCPGGDSNETIRCPTP